MSEALERLKAIVDRLRGPDGCPWDREQTPQTLKPYLLEEAHEVAEAIESGDLTGGLREELGDLLLNVFLQARIGEEEKRFTLDDVAEGISDKLVRRHPHVFGDETAETPDDVRKTWEEIKQQEKPDAPRETLRPLPASLPGLSRAQRTGAMAAEFGFDWPDATGPLEKIEEEVRELRRAVEAGSREEVEGEIGDLLFAITSLCRHTSVDAEAALGGALRKFRRRFGHIERTLGPDSGASLERMEELWQDAKRNE